MQLAEYWRFTRGGDEAEWNELGELVSLATEADSIDFNSAIEHAVQWDNAIDYFIFINLLAAMDNRSKNYFLVRRHDPSGKTPQTRDGRKGHFDSPHQTLKLDGGYQ